MRSCLLFITIVFTLKIENINTLDDLAKIKQSTLFLERFPNSDHRFNTILAPFAFRNVILATSLVAKRKTQAELESLLFGETLENIARSTLLTKNTESKIRLFVNKNTDITPCLKKLTHNITEYVDFSTNEAKKKMDAFVKKETNGMLHKIFNKKFENNSSYVTLVYNEYMDISWKKKFQEIIPARHTVNDIYISKPVMKRNDVFMYANLTDLGVQVIQLPLKNGVKLLALQPYDIMNFKENFVSLKNKLLSVGFTSILKRLKRKKISLLFPMLDKVKMERPTLSQAANNVTILLYTKYLAYFQNYLSLL